MFRHFKVAVSKVESRSKAEVVVYATVCVRSLPPDPQGNRTRISWDPWSVRAGNTTIDAKLTGVKTGRLFPQGATYGVGDCASGIIPFPTTKKIDEISYENGLGDRAVWDADRLNQPPAKGKAATGSGKNSSSKSIGEGTFIVNDDIQPGRYKARATGSRSCYWARLNDTSGEADSIIANNLTDGSAVVTIKASDAAFETNGCTRWIRQ